MFLTTNFSIIFLASAISFQKQSILYVGFQTYAKKQLKVELKSLWEPANSHLLGVQATALFFFKNVYLIYQAGIG